MEEKMNISQCQKIAKDIGTVDKHYVKITTSEDYDITTVEIGSIDDDFFPDKPKPRKWKDFSMWVIVVLLWILAIFFLWCVFM